MMSALRLAWADRVAAGVAHARPWAAGAVALFVARDPGLRRTALTGPARTCADRLLGRDWSRAASAAELADAVSPAAAWALRGVRDQHEVWRAEVRWWARLRADGARLLAATTFGPDPAIGAVALLAVDVWQARAALEIAARAGGAPADTLGVFDAVA